MYFIFWGSLVENYVEVYELLLWSFVSSGLEFERILKVIVFVVGVIGIVFVVVGFIYCFFFGIVKLF